MFQKAPKSQEFYSAVAVSTFSNTVSFLYTPGHHGSAAELEFGLRNFNFQPFYHLPCGYQGAWLARSHPTPKTKVGNVCSAQIPCSQSENHSLHSRRYFLDAQVLIVRFCSWISLLGCCLMKPLAVCLQPWQTFYWKSSF